MTNKGKNLIIIFLLALLLLFLFSIIMNYRVFSSMAEGSDLCYNEICPGQNDTITLQYYSIEGICVCATYGGQIVYAQPISLYLEENKLNKP